MIINLKKLLIIAVAGVLCLSAVFLASALETESVKLPILMYHHISERNGRLNKYTISPDELESDLDYIQKSGYTTVGIQDLINYTNGGDLPDNPIMITFDDGYESVYDYAYPALKKHNMKAVVNIIAKYSELYSKSDDHNVNYAHLTFEQLREMTNDNTFEIGNHTYDLHSSGERKGIQKKKNESDVKYAEIISADIKKAQIMIADNVYKMPAVFAYPFGTISKQALPVLKRIGFSAVFCCWEKENTLTGDKEELYHLNRFNRPHGKSAEKILSSAQSARK